MYPEEIKAFLASRNFYIGGDELEKIIDTKENPQYDHIKFEPSTMVYEIWDKEGNYYAFKAMSHDEAVSRGLVKPENHPKINNSSPVSRHYNRPLNQRDDFER